MTYRYMHKFFKERSIERVTGKTKLKVKEFNPI